MGSRPLFFCVGKRVREHPDLVAALVKAGHTAANHSHGHAWWTNFLGGRRLDLEIRRAQQEIFRACGRTPAFFRPPVGLSNPHLHQALRKNGLTLVGWDVRSYDRFRDPDAVLRKILQEARDGAIILLHDRRDQAGELEQFLDRLIPALKEKGFNLIGLDESLGLPPYLDPGDSR
ncbi:MAG: polysaccharide deacetylase family protein [Pseudomonadota bacterium]